MSTRSVPTYSLPETLPTDPILADLLPEFASQWLKDLSVTWSDIQQSQDNEALRRFGHTIKGSFLQFGFREMSVAGKEIMNCAEANDWKGAEVYVQALRMAMEQLARRTTNNS